MYAAAVQIIEPYGSIIIKVNTLQVSLVFTWWPLVFQDVTWHLGMRSLGASPSCDDGAGGLFLVPWTVWRDAGKAFCRMFIGGDSSDVSLTSRWGLWLWGEGSAVLTPPLPGPSLSTGLSPLALVSPGRLPEVAFAGFSSRDMLFPSGEHTSGRKSLQAACSEIARSYLPPPGE